MSHSTNPARSHFAHSTIHFYTNMDSLAVPVLNEECRQEKPRTCVERWMTPNGYLVLFFLMNTLNYMERVVVSGSSEKILEFIRESVSTHANTYFGALTSIFIGGYSIASIVFGYYVTRVRPFRVVVFGLICWFLAAVASGLAPNYWVLLIARMVSGVGEAGFQIVVPAYINDAYPKEKVGFSMSILYAALSFGTAAGFMLSGFVSQHYSWRLMYLAVAPFMIPAIVILFFVSYEPSKSEEGSVSFCTATFSLLKTPLFIASFIVEAAGVYLCGAYLAFGNQLLIHLGLFTSESISSLVFGAICCVAGVIGSLLGGYALNRFRIDESFSRKHRLSCYAFHLFICCAIASLCFFVTAFATHIRWLFLLGFFLGFTAVFASNPSWTLVILNSTTPLLQPMALGVAMVFYHLLGDVPAPIIVGRFLDWCLHRAKGDPAKEIMAYVYTHWFILLSLIIVLGSSLLVHIYTSRDYAKEKELAVC